MMARLRIVVLICQHETLVFGYLCTRSSHETAGLSPIEQRLKVSTCMLRAEIWSEYPSGRKPFVSDRSKVRITHHSLPNVIKTMLYVL
jgi:hypothetical protein